MPLQTKEFEDIVTLSRPSPKWVWNKEGVLVEVPADQPAYDHDPLTGYPLGLRLEREATNGYTNGKLNIAVTDYTLTDPSDPFMPDAKVLTDDVGHTGGQHTNLGDEYPFGSGGGSNSGLRVIYAKEGLSRYVRLGYPSANGGFTFDLENREILAGSVEEITDPKVKQMTGGWWELSFVTPWANASRNSYRVSFGSSASGTNVTSEIGDQITLAYPSMYDTNNPTPGSIIPTDGSAVTRAADVATIENLDTAEWFSNQEFTIFWHYRLRSENIGTGSSSVSLSIRPNGPLGYDNAIGIYGNNRWYIFGLGNGSIGSFDSETKLAFSIKSDRTLIYANGALLEEILGNAVINLQAAGRITVSLGRFQGELYDCRTFKRALTAAELQELTS